MAGQFLSHLPDNFYRPLKQEVVTMEAMKKCVKVGCGKVYDMEKLYARLLIVSQSRHIDLSELFKYELSPVPSSPFDEYGDMATHIAYYINVSRGVSEITIKA